MDLEERSNPLDHSNAAQLILAPSVHGKYIPELNIALLIVDSRSGDVPIAEKHPLPLTMYVIEMVLIWFMRYMHNYAIKYTPDYKSSSTMGNSKLYIS